MSHFKLSPRENQLWECLARNGLSNQELAIEMGISVKRIEQLISNICNKLRLAPHERNRTVLVIKWWELNCGKEQ